MFDYQPGEDVELFAAQLEHLGWATLAPLVLKDENKAPNMVQEPSVDLTNVFDRMPQNDGRPMS